MVAIQAVTISGWMKEFLDRYGQKPFKKSRDHTVHNEQDLLKIVKYFFLGKFPNVEPEAETRGGRLDFRFGDTALEIVVKNKSGVGSFTTSSNNSELSKLRRHRGRSVLALINMEKSSTFHIRKQMTQFKDFTLGKGNHKLNAITVLYFARSKRGYQVEKFYLRRKS